MKRFIITFALLVALSPALVAQQAPKRMNNSMQQQQQQLALQRKNMSSDEFLKFQIDIMTKQLFLKEGTVEPFAKLYTEFYQKMSELQPKRRQSQPQTPGAKRPRLTAEEVEAQILESFDITERSNALRRDYYFKFKEILTPQRILKMYNFERRLRERMLSESERRVGGGAGAPKQGGGRPQQQSKDK